MAIHEELTVELKDAMKARDRDRLDVIRQIETEVSKAKTEPGFTGDADDSLYRSVIAAYSKKMDKARDEFAALGERGAEAVIKLTFEIDYLSRWLPQGLSEDETREVVRIAIKELQATDAKQLGQVVGHIMKNGPKGVDGATVKRLVGEALGA
jgi:uncharacterized protein YqeY